MKNIAILRQAGELTNELVWLPELGIGYFPVADTVTIYDKKYFENYVKYDRTDKGINATRVELVHKFHEGSMDQLCDIGIGCGAFVKATGCKGFDINPAGIEWLNEHDKMFEPQNEKIEAITCWDSLEHIKTPSIMLNNVTKTVFVSCPIYRSVDHMLGSKHFKKGEHVWYWTREGLRYFMKEHGFNMVHQDARETLFGREDIESFVFVRDQ